MTSPVQELHGASLRLAAFWKAVASRLTTPEATTIMNGGRVYRGTEDYGTPPRQDNQPWGRQVIIPGTTLWPAAEIDSSKRGWNWLIRSEMNDFTGQGYDVTVPLERLQQIAWERLSGWLPVPGDVGVVLRAAIYRQRAPQAMPEWDAERNLWWLSSEWRCEASRIST